MNSRMTANIRTAGLKKSAAGWWSEFQNFLVRTWPYARDFIVHIIGQGRVLSRPYAGLMHALLFWGVTIQILGTAINLMQMQLFIPFVELSFPRSTAYLLYELVMDLAGVAILLGVLMAALRRAVLRPAELKTHWDDWFALGLLGLIAIVGFSLEALRLLATEPAWASWSPVGNAVAAGLRRLGVSTGSAMVLHLPLFWTHIILGLAFIASIPFTKLRHLVTTPLNVLLRPRRKEGTIPFIENIEEAETLGIGHITEFSPRQLLSFDACLNCGRCEAVCPVALSGIPYSPRSFIQELRQTMVTTLMSPNGQTDPELVGKTMPEAMPWACTTCGACLTACPAFINPIDQVVDLRRYQVLSTGNVPKSVGDVLRNLERAGNPWGLPTADRTAWTDGLEIRELQPGEETDVLLFMGCTASYDERNVKVARALVSLLQQAGLDFAILGPNEGCCGETARRLGHEYLFQMLAEQNIETFSQVKFRRLVTQCPHCFNTLKNEYPQLGGNYEVLHYTQLLTELALELTLDLPGQQAGAARVTFHDPCYLGRYNQVYAEPRDLLKQVGISPLEMDRRGKNSFCCGGGGGQMWLESEAETRVNRHRLQDALAVQADVVATACPYCLLMFEDAIHSQGLTDQIQTWDIAEVLAAELSLKDERESTKEVNP